MAAVESMAIYGLYKVTMDLAVCYELKSEFADEWNSGDYSQADSSRRFKNLSSSGRFESKHICSLW